MLICLTTLTDLVPEHPPQEGYSLRLAAWAVQRTATVMRPSFMAVEELYIFALTHQYIHATIVVLYELHIAAPGDQPVDPPPG